MTTVTVILPTFNRSDLLRASLKSLATVDYPSGQWDVIVVDDGSSDSTFETVRSFMHEMDITYVYQADHGFRAARARNLGLRMATGEVAILVDSGVVVGREFLRQHVELLKRSSATVSVGYVYGFSNDDSNSAELTSVIAGEPSAEVLGTLEQRADFPDIRDDIFDRSAGDLMSLPAPWALAWTCNLAIDRSNPGHDVLFDESFVGWGGEDLEFALSLYRAGAVFKVNRRAAGLHVPHEKSAENNSASSARNKRYLHTKHQLPETEVLMNVSAVDLNSVLLEHGTRA